MNATAAIDIRAYKLKPWNRVTRLAWGALFAHIGVLTIVAVYYLLFEVNPTMTHWWHSVVSNGDLRHTIRDVAEGVLGALLAKGIMWNHFTKGHEKAGRVYDFIRRFHIPSTLAALLSFVLLLAATFTVAWLVLGAVHVHVTEHAATGSYWNKVQAIWTSGWQQKIIGFVATFIAVRPLHNMFDDIQGYFAGKRAASRGRTPFFYPANFRVRVRFLVDHPSQRTTYGTWTRWVLPLGMLVTLGLAGYGWYILTYIA